MRKPCREDLQSPAGVNPSVPEAPGGERRMAAVVVAERAASRCAKTLRSKSPGDQLKASLSPGRSRQRSAALRTWHFRDKRDKEVRERSPLTGEHVCSHVVSMG